MARKKTAWDEIYNVRRRLQRQLKREQAAGVSNARIRELQASINATKGKASAEKLNMARSIGKALSSGKPTSVQRRTAIYKQQINTAGEPGSIYSSRERDIFFVATRRIWVGKYDESGRYLKGSENPATRIERIMAYFYKSDASDAAAFRRWQRRTYGTERQDLNLLIEYINMMNAEAYSNESGFERVEGASPKNYQRITWFG